MLMGGGSKSGQRTEVDMIWWYGENLNGNYLFIVTREQQTGQNIF